MSNKKDTRENPWTGISLDDLLEEDLTKIHTRSLIKMLRSEYGRDDPILHERIKKELSTREHIPSLKESKKMRQQKAKEQKNR